MTWEDSSPADNRYRCKRCGRVVKGDMIDAHAENVHGVGPVEIDFEPILSQR